MITQVARNEYYPAQIFTDKNGACPLEFALLQVAPGAGQTVVAARAGKKIKVMGWRVLSDSGTAGTFNLRTAVGGAAISPVHPIPADTSPFNDLPVNQFGYMETNVGEGLFANVNTCNIQAIFYFIAYTP